ncbi:hypothetical protein SAMN02745866_04100 [Alteromonadaceae bacterium Bs31]|nr:hypothetical protein SAMN02745866_04100 [Alteromonadaceae bacterium Bs31]
MRLIFLVFSLLITQTVVANGDSGKISLKNKRIQLIADSPNPRAFVYDVVINNGGCSGTTPVLVMSDTSTLYREMYSTLLAAKAGGKEVSIVTKGCKDNNPKIFSVYFH